MDQQHNESWLMAGCGMAFTLFMVTLFILFVLALIFEN